MARSVKGNNNWLVSAIVLVIIVLVSVIPSLNIPNVPTWEDAYKKANLSGETLTDSLPLSVHFIDVGQGDCILIKAKDKAMLIDAGESGNEDKIIDYLSKYGVDTIDYLIATHPHADHIGGMPGVIEKLNIKNVIMPKLDKGNTPTTKTYENFLIAVRDSGAKVIPAKSGANYKLSDAEFTVLSPSISTGNLNNMSVVIKLTYNNTDFLFMGDAEREVENQILENGYDVRADVLKLGHHGSDTATSEKFLKAVDPSLAVITCGKDNSYGHPHSKTLDLLKKYKIDYKRADESGNIIVGSDGEKLTLVTEREAS